MLQAMRYKVEYGALLSSDEEAYSLIKKHENFVNEKLAEIERKYIGHPSYENQIEEEEKEIAEVMREYFLKKDYTARQEIKVDYTRYVVDVKMLILEIKGDVIEKLPYSTLSWKIFFNAVDKKNRSEKEKVLYMKHGVGFTTNLIELLKRLRRGDVVKIWYNFEVGGRVEIYVNERGELEGRYITPYNSTLQSFKKRVGIV